MRRQFVALVVGVVIAVLALFALFDERFGVMGPAYRAPSVQAPNS